MNDLELALLCQDVYDGKIPLRTVGETSFCIVDNPDAIDFIFPGTHDLTDARRDIEAIMVDVGWGRVHSGAWRDIPQVIDAVWDELHEDRLIRFPAHSLGTMEAALAKRVLFQRGFRNFDVLAFEPPHFGNAKAVAYSGNDNERGYQNYKDLFVNDIFTMIPPHLLLEPYVPAANLIRYYQAPSATNEYKEFPENIQMHSLSDCVIPYLKTIFPCASPT